MTIPAPHLLRDVPALAPWSLLSSLGVVFALERAPGPRPVRLAAASALILAAVLEGAWFAGFYFGPYAGLAARDYQYGLHQVVSAAQRLGRGSEPVVITPTINQPYIYVLFYARYPPELFQRSAPARAGGLFAPVTGFDRYRFDDPAEAFAELEHGVFVFPGGDVLPAPPTVVIRYPDGGITYQVVAK